MSHVRAFFHSGKIPPNVVLCVFGLRASFPTALAQRTIDSGCAFNWITFAQSEMIRANRIESPLICDHYTIQKEKTLYAKKLAEQKSD